MANIVVEMSGDEAKLFRSFQKVQQQIRKQEQSLAKSGQAGEQAGQKIAQGADRAERSLKNAGKARDDAFGTGALRQLGSYAAGFASIGAAVAAVTGAMREQREIQRELAEGIREGRGSYGKLIQLAGGDRQRYSQLVQMADKTFREGGVASRSAAGDLMFELESAGIATESNRAFFSKLLEVEPETTPTIQAVGKMQSAFGTEAGSAKQIVSKAFAAAAPVTGASPSAMLTANLRALQSAKMLGLSDEELQAAVSVIAQQEQSPEVAGTQVSSLLQSMSRHGFVEKFKGKSFVEMLDVVRAKKMDTPALIDYFGRKEAQKAFAGLDPERLQARIKEIRAAEDTAAGDAIAIAMESQGGLRAESALKNQVTSMLQREGEQEIAANTLQSTRQAVAIARGETPEFRTFLRWRANLRRMLPRGNEAVLDGRSPEEAACTAQEIRRRLESGESPDEIFGSIENQVRLRLPGDPDEAIRAGAQRNQEARSGVSDMMARSLARFEQAAEKQEKAATALQNAVQAGPTRRSPLDDR